jgi:hypothetical protein
VVFLRGLAEAFADSGVPLWPFVPSTLYSAFLAGETGSARNVVITCFSIYLVYTWYIPVYVGICRYNHSHPGRPDSKFVAGEATMDGPQALG